MRLSIKWGDGVIIGVVLAAAVAVALPFYLRPADRLTCEIVQDGAVLQTIPLPAETTIELNGAVENTIQIDQTAVYFSHSTCPDQVCIRTGRLTRAGQAAVCLPNRVIVRLVGTEAPAVDALLH